MPSTEILTDIESGFSGADYLQSSESEKKTLDQKKPVSDQPEGIVASDDVKSDIKNLLESIPQLNTIFNVTDKIGSGTFSSVYLAQLKNRTTDHLFALKHIIPTSHPSRIENELRCLIDIGGKDNIIEAKACFRERDQVVIVMPYFIHERFQDYFCLLDVEEIRLYMKSLLTALGRVHSVNIIHRDVKPSNFLFNRSGKQFALVDFGLAQRVNTEKSDDMVKPSTDASNNPTVTSSAVLKPTTAKSDERIRASPRKRKLESIENECMPREKVPRLSTLEREPKTRPVSLTSSKLPQEDDRKLKTLDQNRIAQTSFATVFKSTYSKSLKVPQRAVTSRPTFDADKTVDGSVEPSKVRQTSVNELARGKTKRSTCSEKSCDCFGKPTVCNVCLFRTIQHAPRAGTPGFRAPEVLMKYPGQTTAVDIWSAGVIFLSILSRCYPFFKAADDLTSLAQIVSIFGYNKLKTAAKTYGKSLLVTPEAPGHDLKELCERLRQANQSAALEAKSPNDGKKRVGQIPDSAYDLLKCLLDPNPFTRITAVDALKHPFIREVNTTQ